MSAGDDGPNRGSAAAMGVIVGAIVVFAAFAMALLLVWGGAEGRRGAALEAAERREREAALAGLVIPEFTLVAQDGRAVTRDDLAGRWTVLSFGFTHCTLLCPIMHGQLYRVQGLVDDLPSVRLLSVSVDPEHDTVERLAEYSEQMGADPRVWTFARADEQTLARLMTEGLGLGLEVDEATPIDMGGGRTMANLVHSSRFIVISPRVKVVGMYRGTEPGEVDALVRDLRGWARGR